jgi:hypothetical protein
MSTTRTRTDAINAGPADVRERVHVIVPTAVYSLATARTALSLKAGTLPRELRLRRLRYSKRAGRVMILGEWLLTWIREGEVKRERCPSGDGQPHGTEPD